MFHLSIVRQILPKNIRYIPSLFCSTAEETETIEKPKKVKNYKFYMDIEADRKLLGRIHIKLFEDIVPKTAENFRIFASGEGHYNYTWTTFHRIIPGFMCLGGDVSMRGGINSISNYQGELFEDENYNIKHDKPGILSMANKGEESTNGSQFFITFTPCPWLDGKNVAFGEVYSGLDVLNEIAKYGSKTGMPMKEVRIKSCFPAN